LALSVAFLKSIHFINSLDQKKKPKSNNYEKKLKNLVKITFASVLCVAVVAACKKKYQSEPKPNYSNLEIARGVLFLDGPVADAIPQLSDASKFIQSTVESQLGNEKFALAQKNKRAVIEELLNATEKINPGFLSEFKKNMTSQNPQQISLAIQSSNKLLYSTVLARRYGSQYIGSNSDAIINGIFLGRTFRYQS